MGVSRALRRKSKIAPEVAERVRRVARDLGWRPDPKLSRVMTEVRASARRQGGAERLAWLWPDGDAQNVETALNLLLLRAGARDRADELGFALEEFYLEGSGMTAKRLSQMLYARGMAGVIVAPVSFHAHLRLELDWARFASVVIGMGLQGMGLSRVHANHYKMMAECLRQLASAGKQRVGLVMFRDTSERLSGVLEGAFWSRHPLGRAKAEELLVVADWEGDAAIGEWLARARPEVVLAEPPGRDWMNWALDLLPKPERRKIEYATFNWLKDQSEKVSGFDQCFDRIGAAAVDAVVAQFNRNERGLSVAPKTILTEGEWRERRRVRR